MPILTLFILIDFPIPTDSVSMDCQFYILTCHRSKFLNYDVHVNLSLKIVLILVNRAEPDEIPPL